MEEERRERKVDRHAYVPNAQTDKKICYAVSLVQTGTQMIDKKIRNFLKILI